MSEWLKPNFKDPIHWLAFGFGSGLSPMAPGTVGTLAAVPFTWLLLQLSLGWYLLAIVICFVAGVWFCDKTAKDLGVHDYGGIVWDEFVGYFITMIAIAPTGLNLLVGFIFFRIFDIWKPWPISAVDKGVGGGFGIMIDDVIAGIYALVCMHSLVYAGWLN